MDPNLIALVVFVAFAIVGVLRIVGRKRDVQRHGYRLRKPFLSPAERSFYGVLCSAVANDYVVFAKVRVADVITPDTGQERSKWQTAFNQISAKHFDYVLCVPRTLSVVHVVELHDRSHKTVKRAERDNFLRSACDSAGLSLTEFAAKSAYSIDEVRSEISRSQTMDGVSDKQVEPSF